MPDRGYGARKPHQVSRSGSKSTKWVLSYAGETCSSRIESPSIIKADLRECMLPHGKEKFEKKYIGRAGEHGGSGQGLHGNACVRALPEQGGGIRYVRRNGAHSVSDCVEKVWRQRSKDARGMLAFKRRGKES